MRVNKFSLGWQLARVKARKIKDVDAKIQHIMSFLTDNQNIYDRERVLNWLKMTSFAYKGEAVKALFWRARDEAKKIQCSELDSVWSFDEFTFDELDSILKDISKRKYNFMHNGTPKDHIVFEQQLRAVLGK